MMRDQARKADARQQTGFLWGALLFLGVMLMFAGAPVTAAVAAENTVSTSNGTETNLQNCTDLLKEISDGMSDGGKSAWIAGHRIFSKAAPGDIKRIYCMSTNFKVFSLIYMATSLLGILGAIVQSIIQELVDYACSYVMTMIDNALSYLCLPMPDLGMVDLGLTLPASESCDGMPLLQATRAPNYKVDLGLTQYFRDIQRDTGATSSYYNYDILQ